MIELASLSLEELSVEDSELVLSTLDEFVPLLIAPVKIIGISVSV